MMKAIFCRSFLMVAPLTALRRGMQAEINFASSLVSLADQDNDGKVSHAELAAVLGKLDDDDRVAAASFLDNNFGDMDADADGLLGHDEVLNLVQAFKGQQKAAAITKDASHVLELADSSGDGKASLAELSALASQVEGAADGELAAFLHEQFAAMDADSDGKLDQSEISGLLQALEASKGPDDAEDDDADDAVPNDVDENDEPSDDEEDQPSDEEEDKDSADPQNDENAEPSDDEEDQPSDEEEDEDSADPQDDENAEPSDDEEDQPADEEEDKDSDAADNAAEASIFDRVIKEAEQKAGRMEDPEQILTEAENDAGLKDLAKKMGFDSTRIIEALRQNYEHIVHDEEKKSHIKVN